MRSEPLTEEQKQLVAEHVGWAEKVAKRRINHCVSLEDRTQDAVLGLVDAARSFDPARGVKFETHAYARVIGEILDAERSAGTGPAVKISRRARENGYAEIKVTSVEACNMANNLGGGRDAIASDFLFVDDAPPIADAVDRRDAIDRALTSLSVKEREAVRLYWLEGRTMKQAAAAIGVSESRVSQVMSDVLPRLAKHRALASYAEVA